MNVDLRIAKGQKVFFGRIDVSGNTKTRDNVIRREIEVEEADLYSGVGLVESKRKIARLGFFEEVKIIKEMVSLMLSNLNVRVKRNPLVNFRRP